MKSQKRLQQDFFGLGDRLYSLQFSISKTSSSFPEKQDLCSPEPIKFPNESHLLLFLGLASAPSSLSLKIGVTFSRVSGFSLGLFSSSFESSKILVSFSKEQSPASETNEFFFTEKGPEELFSWRLAKERVAGFWGSKESEG
jgi:hypothetical protein